jgi:hypothetical protein
MEPTAASTETRILQSTTVDSGVAVKVCGEHREGSGTMKLKRAIGAMAVLVAATLVGLGLSTPAFAARNEYARVFIDFEPPTRDRIYEAWVNNVDRRVDIQAIGGGWGWIELTEYNTAGNVFTLKVEPNLKRTWYLPQPVRTFRMCGDYGFAGYVQCSAWKFVDQ